MLVEQNSSSVEGSRLRPNTKARKAACGLAAATLCWSLSARGEEKIAAEIEPVKDEIVVSSTLPELATEVLVPADDLATVGNSDLLESLRRVAGVSAVRRGAVNLDPVVRGLREAQLLATVDGARTFAAGPARMDSDLSHVGRHAIETVRIVKGPYALARGAGALSAIELTTHRPRLGSDWGGEVGGSWASNADRADGFTNLWGGTERLRVYVGVGYRTGGDYEAGDGSTVAGDYESTDTRWRIGAQLTDRLELDWSGGYQHQEDLDYPGRILDATYFYARSHSLELTWTGDRRIEQIHGQVYSNRKDHLMNNDSKPTARDMPGRIPPFGLRVELPTESNTTGGRLRVDLGGSDVEWSFGADLTRVEQTATRSISRRSNDFLIFTDRVWPDVEIDTAGAWLQGTRQIGRAQWGATIRFDHVTADAGTPSEFFRSLTDGELKQEEDNFSAAVSGRIELDERWTLQGGLGRAVRSASGLERYSDRFPSTQFQISAEVMGDPQLDPEASHELDLGLEYSHGGLVAEVELFYRTIEDYITLAPDPSLPRRLPLSPPTVYRAVNGDRATFQGAELSFDHRLDERFSWHGDVSWVRADDQTFDEPVLGISPLTARWQGRAMLMRDRLWLTLGALWADDQDRVASRRFEQPTDGHTLFDLGLELSLAGWTLELDVENLSDETYADHLNAPNPFTGRRVLEIGRTVRVGFRTGF